MSLGFEPGVQAISRCAAAIGAWRATWPSAAAVGGVRAARGGPNHDALEGPDPSRHRRWMEGIARIVLGFLGIWLMGEWFLLKIMY